MSSAKRAAFEMIPVTAPCLELPASRSAAEINALHAKVAQGCYRCEQELHAALVAAWQAGGLLRERKKEVRRTMGHGAWIEWLAQNFAGSERTAQRYMLLAKTVTDVSLLGGLSLRQTYMKLGLSVERKGLHETVALPPLPRYIRATHRFLAALPAARDLAALSTAERARYRRDLQPAWLRLKLLFAGADTSS